MIYYFKKLRNLTDLERKLIFLGIIFKLKYLLIIEFLPLKFYMSLFTSHIKKDISINSNYFLIVIRKTLQRINKIFPYRNTCLINVLIASRLLRLYGIDSTIQFELLKNNKSFINAHAYLTIDNSPVYLYAWKRKHYNVIIN